MDKQDIKNGSNGDSSLYFQNLFDWKFYLSNHEDLQKNGIKNATMAWNHLNNHGYKENRVPFKDPKVFEQFKEFKSGQIEKVFESEDFEEFIKTNGIKQLYISKKNILKFWKIGMELQPT